MSIVPYIVVFIVAFALGWHVRQYVAIKSIERIIEKLEREEEEQQQEEREDSQYIKLKIEQHGNTYYAYGLDNDVFLSQGTSREELEHNLRERFPGKRFAASDENLKEIFNEPI